MPTFFYAFSPLMTPAGMSGPCVSFKKLPPTDAALVEEAINLARESDQEFADAYIFAASRKAGAEEIATFNLKHFHRLGAQLHSL
jgi:hypothetical protein